ncbi:MAG: hypothetical protein AAF125_13800, partial [Chloroflexota bacterium]
MTQDERTPQQREEDWLGRIQPMHAVDDDQGLVIPTVTEPLPHRTDAPPIAQPPPVARKRWRQWGRRTLVGFALLTAVYMIIPPPPVDILILGVDARPGEGYVTRT